MPRAKKHHHKQLNAQRRTQKMAVTSQDDPKHDEQSRTDTHGHGTSEHDTGANASDGPMDQSDDSRALERNTALQIHPLVNKKRDEQLARLRKQQKRARKQAQADRVRSAIELRKAGATYNAIAQQLGWKNPGDAMRAVKNGIERAGQEERMTLQAIQMERLTHMLLVLWPQVQAGDKSAINTALSVWDRITRIGGVDVPIEHNVHVDGNDRTTNVLVIGGDTEAYKSALARMAGLELPASSDVIDVAGTSDDATQQIELTGGQDEYDNDVRDVWTGAIVKPGEGQYVPAKRRPEAGSDALPGVAVPTAESNSDTFPRIASDVGDRPRPAAPHTGDSSGFDATPGTGQLDDVIERIATAMPQHGGASPEHLADTMERLRAKHEHVDTAAGLSPDMERNLLQTDLPTS